MKKLFSLSIIITVFVSLFSPTGNLQTYAYANSVHESVYSNNQTEQSSIGILSTSVYPDNAVVKYGEKIYINYSFNDEAHPVLINIYKDGVLQADYYYKQSSWGDKFSYDPKDEGSYRFVVKPTDQPYYTNECTVTVYKDRIIFLPGIMGSELFLGDEQLWEPEDSHNLPRIRSQINSLQMTTLGESKNNISVHNSISDYDGILAFFKNEGYHVVDFPYDWRLGSSINAQKLKERINIEQAASPYSNYYIVAHSMGGLVATEFIRQGNSQLIKKMITIGTPFLGAPQAINMLETGNLTNDFLATLLAGDAVKKLEKNVPSIYELIPTKDYFSYQTNGYIETQSYQDPYGPKVKVTKYNTFSDTESYIKNTRDWSNNGLLDKAKNFHSALDVLNTLKKVDSYFIVGDQKATPGKLVYHSLSINDKVIADVKSIQGDSVVPVSSATVGFKLEKSRTFYITRSHVGLVKSPEVQQKILKILKDKPNEFVSDKIRNETKEIRTIKFKAECPVELHINDSSGNHTGPIGTEAFESNIPDINYFTDGETKIALVNATEDYKVRIVGTGYGELTFSIVWANEKDIEDRTLRFDNVAVTPGSIFKADVNQNGQVVLQIDQNGDGNFEGSVSPSVELDLGGTQDETVPTLSSHVDGVKGVNEWYGKNVYYNLSGEDNASGIYKYFYDLNDTEYKEYTEPLALPNTGIYNFKSYVRDKNRNDSEVLTETVKVDTSKPTVPVMTVDPTTWTNKFVTITLDGGTDADSGFQKYQYKINQDGEWKDYTVPVVIDKEGLYTIYARTVDNVFNLSDEVSGVAKLDKTIPQKPIMTVEPLKWTNQFVTVSLSGGSDTDKGYPNSGFQKYQYKIGQNGAWNDYTIPIIFDVEGLYNVFARSVDNAFNLSDDVIGEAKVDKTKPSRPTGFKTLLKTSNKVKISWLPSTDNVGVIGYDIYQDSKLIKQITGNEFTFENLVLNKTYRFKIVARDEAGNSSLDGIFLVRTPINISAGASHSLLIQEDGSVWSWGNNRNGQLGDGTLTSKTTSVHVTGIAQANSVAAGTAHSLALKSDGTVWSWGSNVNGQLGTGNNTESLVPVQVKSLSGVIAIATGENSSYALKSDGTVWSWGSNTYGQLGDNTTVNRNTPVQVLGVSGVTELTAGRDYAYALASDGTVWGWGKSNLYQIIGSTTPTTPKAVLITGLTDVASVAAVSANYNYGLALKKDGSLVMWGGFVHELMPFSGPSGIQALGSGGSNSVITADGSLWSGQDSALSKVANVSNVSAVSTGLLNAYTVALTSDGSVWSWGGVNTAGQLGDGTTIAHTTPALVKEDTAPKVSITYPLGSKEAPEELQVTNPSIRWTQADAALTNFTSYQVQILDASGSVVVDSGVVNQSMTAAVNAWTVNQALPSNEVLQVRVKVQDEHLWSEWSESGWLRVKGSSIGEPSKVSAGASHTLLIKEDGSVWSWGNNRNGQLGDGTLTSKTTSVHVTGIAQANSVAAGTAHSLALKSDGTVWSWGSNVNGQLGTGNNTESLVPVQVKSLSGVIAIATGENSSYALKSDGTVWSWGSNTYGQLGDNTTVNRNTPVQVLGVSGVTELTAGRDYAYALASDGTVWGWGKSNLYQIIGSTTPTTPKAVLITGLTDVASVAAVSANYNYGLALKKDGSLVMWGGFVHELMPFSGPSGIQALGSGGSNSVITADGSLWSGQDSALSKVANVSNVSAVSTGLLNAYTVALTSDGSVWSWGGVNTAGQLGDGTTIAHTTPALVKEDTAPKVSITYPLGNEEAPEEIIINKPTIKWNQKDADLTLFTAYQVQILNETGDIIVDSGEMVQNSALSTGSWTVEGVLPEFEPVKVQVRVKDQQVWSEWSEEKWFVIYNALGAKLSINQSIEKFSVVAGERATVSISVYDKINTDSDILNGILKVKISGYDVAPVGSSGQFGEKELSSDGETTVDVVFTNGVAEIPLILNVFGKQKIFYEVLDIINSLKVLEIYVMPSEALQQTLRIKDIFRSL